MQGNDPRIPQDAPHLVWRPTSLVSVGVVGSLIGVLSIIFGLYLLIPHLTANATLLSEEMKKTGWLYTATTLLVSGGIGLSAMLLVGIAGAMDLREWGRWALMIYAVAMIVLTSIEIIVIYEFTVPLVYKVLQAGNQDTSKPVGWIELQLLIALLFRIGYPMFVLVVMNRRSVKGAFHGGKVHLGSM